MDNRPWYVVGQLVEIDQDCLATQLVMQAFQRANRVEFRYLFDCRWQGEVLSLEWIGNRTGYTHLVGKAFSGWIYLVESTSNNLQFRHWLPQEILMAVSPYLHDPIDRFRAYLEATAENAPVWAVKINGEPATLRVVRPQQNVIDFVQPPSTYFVLDEIRNQPPTL